MYAICCLQQTCCSTYVIVPQYIFAAAVVATTTYVKETNGFIAYFDNRKMLTLIAESRRFGFSFVLCGYFIAL